MIEYQPVRGALTGRAVPFTAHGGLPFQQNLGSPVFAGGYLYLFAVAATFPGSGRATGPRHPRPRPRRPRRVARPGRLRAPDGHRVDA